MKSKGNKISDRSNTGRASIKYSGLKQMAASILSVVVPAASGTRLQIIGSLVLVIVLFVSCKPATKNKEEAEIPWRVYCFEDGPENYINAETGDRYSLSLVSIEGTINDPRYESYHIIPYGDDPDRALFAAVNFSYLADLSPLQSEHGVKVEASPVYLVDFSGNTPKVLNTYQTGLGMKFVIPLIYGPHAGSAIIGGFAPDDLQTLRFLLLENNTIKELPGKIQLGEPYLISFNGFDGIPLELVLVCATERYSKLVLSWRQKDTGEISILTHQLRKNYGNYEERVGNTLDQKRIYKLWASDSDFTNWVKKEESISEFKGDHDLLESYTLYCQVETSTIINCPPYKYPWLGQIRRENGSMSTMIRFIHRVGLIKIGTSADGTEMIDFENFPETEIDVSGQLNGRFSLCFPLGYPPLLWDDPYSNHSSNTWGEGGFSKMLKLNNYITINVDEVDNSKLENYLLRNYYDEEKLDLVYNDCISDSGELVTNADMLYRFDNQSNKFGLLNVESYSFPNFTSKYIPYPSEQGSGYLQMSYIDADFLDQQPLWDLFYPDYGVTSPGSYIFDYIIDEKNQKSLIATYRNDHLCELPPFGWSFFYLNKKGVIFTLYSGKSIYRIEKQSKTD